jgi:hypothetical protein
MRNRAPRWETGEWPPVLLQVSHTGIHDVSEVGCVAVFGKKERASLDKAVSVPLHSAIATNTLQTVQKRFYSVLCYTVRTTEPFNVNLTSDFQLALRWQTVICSKESLHWRRCCYGSAEALSSGRNDVVVFPGSGLFVSYLCGRAWQFMPCL